MKKFSLIIGVSFLLPLSLFGAVQSIVIMPFANLSKDHSLQWISESFPELLQDRLVWPNLNILGRDERLVAFDRIGIPYTSQLSKASLIKIGQELDSSFLVLGDFTCDGRRLQASASLLDLKKNQLGPVLHEEGNLEDLQLLSGKLAWQILKYLNTNFPLSKDSFVMRFSAIPNIALENYVRGLMESDRLKQIGFFRQADKAFPNYAEAIFQLGRIYYQQKDYSTSTLWLQRLTRVDKNFSSGIFLLGLDHLHLHNYEKAGAQFQQLSQTLPLNTVFSNLGIALSIRGLNDKASEAFRKAIEGDPTGTDFHVNLAYHYWKTGNFGGAVQTLKELLQKGEPDGEAYYLLYKCQQALGKTEEAERAWEQAREMNPEVENWESRKRIPDLFRIQSDFDETSFRQLRLEIEQLQNNKAADLSAAPKNPIPSTQVH